MTSLSNYPVAVIGAGPVGLAAAAHPHHRRPAAQPGTRQDLVDVHVPTLARRRPRRIGRRYPVAPT